MSRDDTLASAIQPQSDTGSIMGPHLATANLTIGVQADLPQARDRVFESNESIWAAIIGERIRAHMVATLRGFHLFEWFPRAPGLYHTPLGLASEIHGNLVLG
jgi:hypothetical protein